MKRRQLETLAELLAYCAGKQVDDSKSWGNDVHFTDGTSIEVKGYTHEYSEHTSENVVEYIVEEPE